MFAQGLIDKLQGAFDAANLQRHTEVTVECLLLAILDDASVNEALIAKAVDVDRLRCDLVTHIEKTASVCEGEGKVETNTSMGYKRVILRATMWVQEDSDRGNEITGTHLLMAIYREMSQSVKYLHAYGVTRQDVIDAIRIKAPG